MVPTPALIKAVVVKATILPPLPEDDDEEEEVRVGINLGRLVTRTTLFAKDRVAKLNMTDLLLSGKCWIERDLSRFVLHSSVAIVETRQK